MDLKPADLNNIEEYLQRFERIYKDNNLTTEQTKHLLRLFAHNNESVAQWLTRHNELYPLCTWDVLKNDLLKEFLSPYWKSEKYSKLFKIQYYHGETVPEFIGRFQDLLKENNIAFTVPDPQQNLLKELLFSKLPDSVKRVLNNKPVSEFPTILSLMQAVKEFPGIPTDMSVAYASRSPSKRRVETLKEAPGSPAKKKITTSYYCEYHKNNPR
ncbi:hypothetical protein ROZALSC1DRAFT_25998, partial [Rozella allomycis CSF55]